MHILVVQNFDGAGLGQIATALDVAGARVDVRHAHRGDELPASADGHDGLIVLGGVQNALADQDHPYLPDLCGLMRAFADSDRAVLGVCLGSQLLARAYGAENIIGGASEFGWRMIELTEEGREDPLFSRLPGNFPSFQWHDDSFVLPRGGTRLAGNLVAHNQAFRIRRAAYGIQFHFEADMALVEEWSGTFAAHLAERQPDWTRRHPIEAEKYGPFADSVGLAIAHAWARLV